jgi:chromosome segregation ATPase
MKRALFVIVLIGLVVAVVLAIKYSREANQVRQDLAAQSDTTAVVRSQLAAANDSLSGKIEQLGAMAGELDSISGLYAQSLQRGDRLAAAARGLRATVDSLKVLSATHQSRIDELTTALTGAENRLADTVVALTTTRKRVDSTTTLLTERTVLISRLQPWYAKWKHDATERNWLEKLFGSDKAKTPDFPEPMFPSVSVDTGPSDTAAEPQASR